MGYVVSAIHTQLDQRVAVKFMVPEICQHPEAVARFLREARAAVRIRSEHVAKVLDVGTLDDGAPYMVMEFLWGRDLATVLEEQGPLPVHEAAEYVLQACEALAEAHAHGIVHRDLKPANLFLTRRPDGSALIKVLDFGISKAVTDQATRPESLTTSQSLIGSPHYMSPEQVRYPKTVGPRSDVWALGVILHELVTGTRPFVGDTAMSVLAAVVSDPAPRLRDRHPELVRAVDTVIQRCLEKDPVDRYASVADFALALGPLASPAAHALVARIQGITRARLQEHSTLSEESGLANTLRILPAGDCAETLKSAPSSERDPRRSSTRKGWITVSEVPRARGVKWFMVALSVVILGILLGLDWSHMKRPAPAPARLGNVSERTRPRAAQPASTESTDGHATVIVEPGAPLEITSPASRLDSAMPANPRARDPAPRAPRLAPPHKSAPNVTRAFDPLDERR